MGFLKFVAPPHYCRVPDITKAGVGSIWKCPECGQIWKLVHISIHDDETNIVWSKINKPE